MLVDFDGVMAAYEGEPPTDRQWVERRIEEAERLLFARCPVSRHLAQSGESRALVEDVIIRAVLRVVRDKNPHLRSEGLGDYNYEKERLVASGNLWFPAEDLAALGCGGGARIGSVRVSPDATFANMRPRRVVQGGGWW